LCIRFDRRGCFKTSVHYRRDGEFRDADSTCIDVHSKEHQATWRKEMEFTTPADLRSGDWRSSSLLYAGESGYSRTDFVWRGCRGFAGLSSAEQIRAKNYSTNSVSLSALAALRLCV